MRLCLASILLSLALFRRFAGVFCFLRLGDDEPLSSVASRSMLMLVTMPLFAFEILV